MQEGDVPFPGQIRLLRVGSRRGGPGGARWAGTVFCLHPHQDVFIAPAAIAGAGAGRRAGAPGDAGRQHGDRAQRPVGRGAGPGDRIVVVGAGVVGLLVASLAARLPGAEVTVVDVDAERARRWSQSLGAPVRAARSRRRGEADVVFHASATRGRASRTAIDCAGLGGHGRRDELVRRQAGRASTGRRVPQPPAASSSRRRSARSRRAAARAGTIGRRIEAALRLLADARARCAGRRGDRLRGRCRASCRASLAPGRARASPPSSAIPQA